MRGKPIECVIDYGTGSPYSSEPASASTTTVTLGCSCSTDAGTYGVTGPKNASRTICALSTPLATTRMARAFMMVPMPMV